MVYNQIGLLPTIFHPRSVSAYPMRLPSPASSPLVISTIRFAVASASIAELRLFLLRPVVLAICLINAGIHFRCRSATYCRTLIPSSVSARCSRLGISSVILLRLPRLVGNLQRPCRNILHSRAFLSIRHAPSCNQLWACRIRNIRSRHTWGR